MLCHIETAAGVIGSFIKQLKRVTGAKIKLAETVANCHERVISVTGNTHKYRGIVLDGEKWNMSELQEGLFRVFERILEVGSNETGMVGCRVLAGKGQVSAVYGEAKDKIKMIENKFATKIQILPPHQLPGCALPGDDLIQIKGDAMAVKKSLIAVAWRLQGKARGTILTGNSLYGGFPRDLIEYSSNVVGGLIGRNGTLVKALEEDIGASIRFSSPAATPRERIVTIASIECPDQLQSPAQIAVIQCFARSMKVKNESDASDPVTGINTIARVLLASDQVSCLIDTEGKNSSNICTATGVQMQLFWGSDVAESDNILEISGLYENVRSALFQVTGRLRKNLFSSTTDEEEPMHNPYSSDSNISSSERENTVISGSDYSGSLSFTDHDRTLIPKMEQLGLLYKPGEENGMTSTARGFGETESDLEQESKEEIEVPVQVIGCIYGKSGTNLARMKQISGASIIMENPPPGKGYVKLIISGTRVSIQIARSLLQAFILPEL